MFNFRLYTAGTINAKADIIAHNSMYASDDLARLEVNKSINQLTYKLARQQCVMNTDGPLKESFGEIDFSYLSRASYILVTSFQ